MNGCVIRAGPGKHGQDHNNDDEVEDDEEEVEEEDAYDGWYDKGEIMTQQQHPDMSQSPPLRRTKSSPSPVTSRGGGILGGAGGGTGAGGGRGVTFEPTTAPFQRSSHSNNHHSNNNHHHSHSGNNHDGRNGNDTGMSSITTGGGGRGVTGAGVGVSSSGLSSKRGRGTRHGEDSLLKLGSQCQGQGHLSKRFGPTSSQEDHNGNNGGEGGGGGGGGYHTGNSHHHCHGNHAPSGSKMKMLLARAACSEDVKVAQTAVTPRHTG